MGTYNKISYRVGVEKSWLIKVTFRVKNPPIERTFSQWYIITKIKPFP